MEKVYEHTGRGEKFAAVVGHTEKLASCLHPGKAQHLEFASGKSFVRVKARGNTYAKPGGYVLEHGV